MNAVVHVFSPVMNPGYGFPPPPSSPIDPSTPSRLAGPIQALSPPMANSSPSYYPSSDSESSWIVPGSVSGESQGETIHTDSEGHTEDGIYELDFGECPVLRGIT